MDEADYVVVGAGSAGCAVAGRLAEAGHSVLLLEAGRSDRTKLVTVPGMITMVHTVPQLKKRLDWGYYTVPQKHAMDRRIPTTRGKVLGGSSSVNGMLFVRGNRRNFDAWAAQGCDGWSYDDVLPSFKRMEDWSGEPGELRGVGGPIAVTRQQDLTGASTSFIDAMRDALGVPFNDDYNGAEQDGVGVFQQSASGGVRYSSAKGYLDGAAGPRVETTAAVARVLVDNGVATGVELVGGRVVRANREVVLAAGVFGSPQILMLSGIGPAGHLRELGITVHSDLPVGQNLHDHLFVPMTYLMRSAVHRGTPAHFLGGMVAETLRGGSWFGRTVFEAVGFLRSSHATDVPDLQIHTLPWSYPVPNQDRPVRHKVDTRPALTVLPTLIYPKSRGEVRLASADPTAAPLIDPAYLSDPRDAEVLLEGIRMIREVMANKHIAGAVGGEFAPGPDYFGDAELARELPNRVHTVYHPVGTCRMGVDERAVVDPALRVRGVANLRVADASIMPEITGGNTNAPAMMIGEHCAALMLRE